MRSRLKGAAVVLVVLAIAGIGAWAVSGPVAVSAARREVEAVAGPRNALVARYPARAAPNAAAVELERLCEPIYLETGATFAPKSRIAIIDAPPSAGALAALESWVNAQLASRDDAISEPPMGVRELLARLRPSLDAIATQLATTRPLWELKPDTLAPEPNAAGVRRIVSMFLAEAFVAQRQGDVLRARAALDAALDALAPLHGPRWDAAWRAIDEQSRIAVAARKIEGIEPAWVDGFAIEAQRAAVIDVVAWDAHAMADIASDPRRLEEVRRLNKSATRAQRLAVPAWKRSIARTVRGEADGIAALRGAAWACARGRAMMTVGPQLAPDFGGVADIAGQRLRELAIHLDLTRAVLALKAERRRAGEWPPEAAEVTRCSCAGVPLEYALRPEPRGAELRLGTGAPRHLPREWRSSP